MCPPTVLRFGEGAWYAVLAPVAPDGRQGVGPEHALGAGEPIHEDVVGEGTPLPDLDPEGPGPDHERAHEGSRADEHETPHRRAMVGATADSFKRRSFFGG